MQVIIKKDYDKCCEWTANYIAKKIKKFAPTENKKFVLGLPTGSTPLGVYKCLIAMNKAKKISFANVVTFNMDEYVGLPATHDQSYHYFMYDNFFNHIDIKKENIHILNGMSKNPVAECAAYEKAIEEAGGIHLFLGGAGVDGHIAFNEPGTSLNSRTHMATLTEDTRIVNSRFFGGNMNKVPKQALTVGVGTICSAKEVVIMLNGYNKAMALQHAVEGSVSQMWPITALQLHENATIVCDDASTIELKVGTVNYYKGL